MDHRDHVALLRDGVAGAGPRWADLGAGGGAFTLALAELLGGSGENHAGEIHAGEIHAVDRDAAALRELERRMAASFPTVRVQTHVADFTRPLGLPPLDGVVMANSLHFQRDKAPVLALVREALAPGGRLILVEYNVDRGNPWVPYPLSFPTWAALAARSGFRATRLLATRPSRFLREFYAALSLR